MPVVCSVIAVVWQLSALVLMRYGIDPIGVVGAVPDLRDRRKPRRAEDQRGQGRHRLRQLDSIHAARRTFRQLLAPAIVALLAGLVGFVTILRSRCQVIARWP
jgi:hypothetical protein